MHESQHIFFTYGHEAVGVLSHDDTLDLICLLDHPPVEVDPVRGDQLVPLGVEAGPPVNNAGCFLAVAAKLARRAEALPLGPGGGAADGDAGDAVAVGGEVAVVLVLAPVARVGPVVALADVPPGCPVAGALFPGG